MSFTTNSHGIQTTGQETGTASSAIVANFNHLADLITAANAAITALQTAIANATSLATANSLAARDSGGSSHFAALVASSIYSSGGIEAQGSLSAQNGASFYGNVYQSGGSATFSGLSAQTIDASYGVYTRSGQPFVDGGGNIFGQSLCVSETSSTSAGAAYGYVWCEFAGDPNPNDYVSINDGDLTVTFTFQDTNMDGVVDQIEESNNGNVSSYTPGLFAACLSSIIQMTPLHLSTSINSGFSYQYLDITNNYAGSAFNQAISVSSSVITASGMSGGFDGTNTSGAITITSYPYDVVGSPVVGMIAPSDDGNSLYLYTTSYGWRQISLV